MSAKGSDVVDLTTLRGGCGAVEIHHALGLLQVVFPQRQRLPLLQSRQVKPLASNQARSLRIASTSP